MSFDKREAILKQILAILQGVAAGIVDDPPKVFRNHGELEVQEMPALILLDGREQIAVSTAGKGGIKAPTVFTLQPQVFAVLRPTPGSSNDGIGELLSAYRMKLLRAFSSDDSLLAMLGTNGEINYTSGVTDMELGNVMLGQMLMSLSLTYVLNPADF